MLHITHCFLHLLQRDLQIDQFLDGQLLGCHPLQTSLETTMRPARAEDIQLLHTYRSEVRRLWLPDETENNQRASGPQRSNTHIWCRPCPAGVNYHINPKPIRPGRYKFNDIILVRVARFGTRELGNSRQTIVIVTGNYDLACSENTGNGRVQESEGAVADDQHRLAGLQGGPSQTLVADRAWFCQSC